jgi:hypothetical protein
MKVNIIVVTMFGVRLGHGQFNEKPNTSIKTSISNSKARMWHPRLWQAL